MIDILMIVLPLLFALIQLIVIYWTINKLLSKHSMRVEINTVNITQIVKFCQYCGTETQDDAMFCPNCGKKFV
jgi:membrane protease subunit (stomatin/prohibitin family)